MKTAKKISTNNESINDAEKKLDFKYPESIRQMLLKRNGFYLADFKFFCVLDKEDIQHTFDDIVRENTNESAGIQNFIPKGYVAIATDEGLGFLVLNTQKDGKTYYWNNDLGELSIYAENDEQLITSLEKEEKEFTQNSK